MTDPTEKGTLTRLFYDAVERHGHKPKAVCCKPAGAPWRSLTHAELAQRVMRTGLALKRLGVRRGDRVAILSENRPGWLVADFACLAIGATDVPIYPTLPAKQLVYILKDSGATAIFVSTAPQLAKILELRSDLPALKHVIGMDEDTTGTQNYGAWRLRKSSRIFLAHSRSRLRCNRPRLWHAHSNGHWHGDCIWNLGGDIVRDRPIWPAAAGLRDNHRTAHRTRGNYLDGIVAAVVAPVRGVHSGAAAGTPGSSLLLTAQRATYTRTPLANAGGRFSLLDDCLRGSNRVRGPLSYGALVLGAHRTGTRVAALCAGDERRDWRRDYRAGAADRAGAVLLRHAHT